MPGQDVATQAQILGYVKLIETINAVSDKDVGFFGVAFYAKSLASSRTTRKTILHEMCGRNIGHKCRECKGQITGHHCQGLGTISWIRLSIGFGWVLNGIFGLLLKQVLDGFSTKTLWKSQGIFSSITLACRNFMLLNS